jgi:hypothetical protein
MSSANKLPASASTKSLAPITAPVQNSASINQPRLINLNVSHPHDAKLLTTPTLAKSTNLGPPVVLNISRHSITSASKYTPDKPTSEKDITKLLAKDTLLEDNRYKTKQLKKQRKQDIQKRFSDLQPIQPKSEIKNTRAAQASANKQKNKGANKSNDTGPNSEGNYKVACHMTFIFDPNGRLSYWMGK